MVTEGKLRVLQREVAAVDIELPRLFAALADQTRFRIFCLLLVHHDLCVTEISRVVGVSVPAASQHLRLLELSGLVVPERRGQMVCYMARTDNPVARLVARLARESL